MKTEAHTSDLTACVQASLRSLPLMFLLHPHNSLGKLHYLKYVLLIILLLHTVHVLKPLSKKSFNNILSCV
jgi:hypothetical protein